MIDQLLVVGVVAALPETRRSHKAGIYPDPWVEFDFGFANVP